MLQTVRNAWNIPELRRKILFTAFILLIYRFGSAIWVPFINRDLLAEFFSSSGLGDTIFGMFDMMSGGAFSQATIFAMSIQPYINASIIMNLLTVGIPALERMVKEGGEDGKKKIASITRFVTVLLGILMGIGYYATLSTNNLVTPNNWFTATVIVLTFTAGTAFIMWLGEQVTEFGIGNGISIILFASIVSRGPSIVSAAYTGISSGALQWWQLIIILALALVVVAFVVFITQAERRIPIQYAKRMVGRKMYGGQSTHLPLKVNMSGVMPIIFAQTFASFPATIAMFFREPAPGTFMKGFLDAIKYGSTIYVVAYFLLILGFSYFYTSIQFNPVEIANNLKQNGGFIPGFRPGKPTSDFISKVINKITLFGALFLAIVALMPILMSRVVSVQGLAWGGTSVLIVVGVALETVKQMEQQMLMRHYKGFLE
ncbi:MAG: preprotein translocase subunit SecY [Oscillospiraceae bacterium]|nr:preprotein translocase subunit SecY [Oscillospiraceae bacterium]